MDEKLIQQVKDKYLGDVYLHGCPFADCLHSDLAKMFGTYDKEKIEAQQTIHFRLPEAEIVGCWSKPKKRTK